jgi:hypothetical protein
MIKILLMMLLVTSCSNIPSKSHQKLFPYGTYHHNISLVIKEKAMSFLGINLWSEGKFVVIGLGPMDITLIKYVEDRKNYKTDLYINQELMPLEERRALQMIGLLKDMYSWDRSICSGKECKKTYFGVPILFELNDLDQVSKIKVDREGLKVNVDVVSYEKIL